ncbi:hypothetical protein Nepgr_012460 [Nepenthes gracilis]|uniref:Uncharacterized protein n=1 Tax=Nepenthes gracilis TaxID=150966 RepID=A0AAD3XN57_NEPGR|nr:hypothetical protein Nepgr_012460 [Nepenthes gracilis]
MAHGQIAALLVTDSVVLQQNCSTVLPVIQLGNGCFGWCFVRVGDAVSFCIAYAMPLLKAGGILMQWGHGCFTDAYQELLHQCCSGPVWQFLMWTY